MQNNAGVSFNLGDKAINHHHAILIVVELHLKEIQSLCHFVMLNAAE